MKNKKRIFLILILFLVILGIIIIIFGVSKSYGLSKYGSTGEEVKEIQTKLKNWGYYLGEIDGIFGSKTLQAVKDFQANNGLTVDGIVGEQTLAALGMSSSTTSSSSSSNSNNLNLLSKLVYAESRGEPYKGQVAVAAVVLNRVSNSSFPNTISGVIYESGAFSVVDDGQINLTPDSTAIKAAQDALNGWDPTSRLYLLF